MLEINHIITSIDCGAAPYMNYSKYLDEPYEGVWETGDCKFNYEHFCGLRYSNPLLPSGNGVSVLYMG